MSISDDLIRQLASHRESPTLDFKEEFYENSPDGNAELAKDIMAMANSLRHDERGYLLFGVAEDPATHLGIIKGFEPQAWVTDSNLQQKVRSLLNRLPKFSWSQVSVDGNTVGVIEIRSGGRPFFPLKDTKSLKRFIAMHRTGSASDIASPDEIVGWSREDDSRRADELTLEQLEQKLIVVPHLSLGAGSKSGNERRQTIQVRNDGEATFSISSGRCSWRLIDQQWRQWLQSVSLRYLSEIPAFVQPLHIPEGTLRAGEKDNMEIIADLDDLERHVSQYFSASVDGCFNGELPLADLLVGEVEVVCKGLGKGRTAAVSKSIFWDPARRDFKFTKSLFQ